ncbi:MAG: hypothetical protein LBQ66_05160 [Planctomycetaceae bacterium]|jgi:hypothetical protein|nr:hypothetical protein [Planctomycetaceae bacterium]
MTKINEFDQTISKVTDEEIGATGVRVGYRAMSVLAIIAFVFSLCTPLMLLSSWFVLFPIIGAACGVWGLIRILSSPFDYTGRAFAVAGVVVSLVLGVVAGGIGLWQYYYSAPSGYEVLDFLDLRPDADKYKTSPHNINPAILELAKDHRKVYVRGFMFPGNQMAGIQDFMMVRLVAHCKFCAPEKNPFDMISVHCSGDLRATYRMNAVHVGGELYFNANYVRGELPFHIEADIIK